MPSAPSTLRKAGRWRGLGVAALVAVIAHVAAWQALTEALPLGAPDAAFNATASSLHTRWLAPTAPLADATYMPSIAHLKAKPADVGRIAPALQSESLDTAKNEEIVASPLAKSAQDATNTIASPAPPTADPSPQAAPPSSQPNRIAMSKLQFPGSIQLAFDGTVMNKGIARKGNGLLVWKSDGEQYELSLEATAMLILSRREKSVGKLSAHGLAPERYSSVRTGRSEQATHFRYDTASIQFSNNKPQEALLAGAQDRLSVLLQLAAMIGGDPQRFHEAQRIQLQVAGLDGAQVWEIQLQDREELTLAGGPVEALKLVRSPRSEYDQRLEIWLLPQMGYLPARIRQSSVLAPEQDYVDLVLRTAPPQAAGG